MLFTLSELLLALLDFYLQSSQFVSMLSCDTIPDIAILTVGLQINLQIISDAFKLIEEAGLKFVEFGLEPGTHLTLLCFATGQVLAQLA